MVNTVLDTVDIFVRSKLKSCDVLLFDGYEMVSERVKEIIAPIAKADVNWCRLHENCALNTNDKNRYTLKVEGRGD